MSQPVCAMARLGVGRPDVRQQILRDVGQQAHDDELGHADAEAADGEGEERPHRRTPRGVEEVTPSC